MRSWTTTISCTILLGLAACGGEEPPPHYAYPEAQVRLDGIVWPDYGPWPPPDKGWPRLDGKRPDAGPPRDGAGDAQPGGDGQPPSCPGPAAAKCAASCASDEVCTEAKGGTCVKQVVLSGVAADKVVLKEVAIAYVNCWNKKPSADTLCYTFNACALQGSHRQGRLRLGVPEVGRLGLPVADGERPGQGHLRLQLDGEVPAQLEGRLDHRRQARHRVPELRRRLVVVRPARRQRLPVLPAEVIDRGLASSLIA
jgi:hypothetical protein